MIFMSNTKGIEGTFDALPALSLVRGNLQIIDEALMLPRLGVGIGQPQQMR